MIDREGEPYVAMKPVVEGMGLAWSPQYTKLRDGADRWGVMMIVIPSAGGEQAMACLPRRELCAAKLRDTGAPFCVVMIPMQMPGDDQVRDVRADRDGFVFADLKLM